MSADFYDLLEVDEDADADELKRAYRRAVRRYHPDVNDREDADAQFKVVKRAYETLSNPKERARYDRLGHRSYVDEQLGGLPTTVVSTVDDGDVEDDSSLSGSPTHGGAAPSSGGDGRWEGRRTGSSRTGSSGRTAESGTGTGAGSGTDAGDNASTRRDNGTSTGPGSSMAGSGATEAPGNVSGSGSGTNTQSTSATNTQSTATTNTQSTSTASSRATAGEGAADAATATAGETGNARADPHLIGLRRGLYASLVGLVAYVSGLAVYLSANATALTALAAEATAAPVNAALSGAGLADPIGYLLGAVSAVTPGIAFGIGVVLLPATLGGTVVRFGRGAARLYGVAALSPLLWLLLTSPIPFQFVGVVYPDLLAGGLPAAVTALLLVVVPIGATVAFVVDIGRYLRAQ